MGIYGVAGERCREVFWEKCYILVAGCSVSDFWGSGSSIHSIDLGQANSTVHIRIV
jgi:hypothetical protein